MTQTTIKTLQEVLVEGESRVNSAWQLRSISSDECISYVLWNEASRESLFIDPKREDMAAYLSIHEQLSDYLCLGIVDTHTHADHISGASNLAKQIGAPYFMHQKGGSNRVHMRVAQTTFLPSRTSPVQFIPTPGHTPDSMCVAWGPFVFTGDTVLFGDVGRDDLPGGDALSHFESIQTLKLILLLDQLILPGHDTKGGRVVSWATQLKINPSLIQEKSQFIREALEFDGAPPLLLKKALFENLK